MKLGIGLFLTYKVGKIVEAKGNWAITIKIIGVLLMIGGTVSFVHSMLNY